MPFQKGQSGNPAGKPKGPNKATKALKEMILGALDRGGGEEWLLRQMDENPTAFMGLIGKVLPTTLQGDPNNPVTYRVITGVKRADD